VALWRGQGKDRDDWDAKIAANVNRDRRVDAELAAEGWRFLRFWDFAIRQEISTVIDRTADFLRSALPEAPRSAWQEELLGRRNDRDGKRLSGLDP